MPAKQSGKSYWDLGTEGDPDKLEAKKEMILGHVIETMQRAVCFFVNQRDTERLIALQACYNEALKQADTALSEGKFMKVSNDIDKGLN